MKKKDTIMISITNLYESPITFPVGESGWNGGKRVLPNRIGSDIDIREVRAVTDLARAEDWENLYLEVLPRLQDNTPHHDVTSRVRRSALGKLAILSPYLGLIGLVSVVSLAVAVKRRKV